MSWQSFNLHTFSYGCSERTPPTNGSLRTESQVCVCARENCGNEENEEEEEANEEKDVDEVKR